MSHVVYYLWRAASHDDNDRLWLHMLHILTSANGPKSDFQKMMLPNANAINNSDFRKPRQVESPNHQHVFFCFLVTFRLFFLVTSHFLAAELPFVKFNRFSWETTTPTTTVWCRIYIIVYIIVYIYTYIYIYTDTITMT